MSAPLYTTVESVKVRLANKVQFQEDPNFVSQGELPNALLLQLISDAETEVEQDLRGRYAIPFRSISQGDYQSLPDHTKRAIRAAIDLRAVVMILQTDFGSGTHISADAYIKSQSEHYEKYISKLLGRDQEASNDKRDRFRFSPPLDDLELSPTNKEADDGFKGMIINTDANPYDAASYAAQQINNPAKNYPTRKTPYGRY